MLNYSRSICHLLLFDKLIGLILVKSTLNCFRIKSSRIFLRRSRNHILFPISPLCLILKHLPWIGLINKKPCSFHLFFLLQILTIFTMVFCLQALLYKSVSAFSFIACVDSVAGGFGILLYIHLRYPSLQNISQNIWINYGWFAVFVLHHYPMHCSVCTGIFLSIW